MAEITAEDIREAFERWDDFARVQGGGEGMTPEEMREKILALASGQDEGVQPEALASLALAVGITPEARGEFYARADEFIRRTTFLPPEQVADYAAFMGLIVGLTARQLAAES
jgi:hypothetical protein